jgi:two-component SAPR family response regulator
MARIYILEPETEVRELLARVAVRLGHEAREYDERAAEEISPDDVLVVEPGDRPSLTTALQILERLPELKIICISIYDLLPEATPLRPCAYLVKPFHLDELERAILEATQS